MWNSPTEHMKCYIKVYEINQFLIVKGISFAFLLADTAI